MRNFKTDKIILVSCVSKKSRVAKPACELYESPFFIKARKFAVRARVPWYILSAKYGLLDPEVLIEPYEQTLNQMSKRERTEWAEMVIHQIEHRNIRPAVVTILAGARYREYIVPYLLRNSIAVEIPMEGLRIGQQLAWLDKNTHESPRT